MKFFTLALGLVSTSAFCAELAPKTLECSFTEPFFNLSLNMQTSELTKSEIDWESPGSGKYISTVVAKDLAVTTKLFGKTYQLFAKNKAGKTLLKATLNYNGSDGMSERISPFDVEYQDAERNQKLYGGCISETGGEYEHLADDNQYYKFTQDVGRAVGLCYNRALADWTDNPSDYLAGQTVFYTLYDREIPTGEPGGVSDTFSSAEGEELNALIKKTKTPAEDGASLNALRQAKWEYCDYYSSRLNSRLEAFSQK